MAAQRAASPKISVRRSVVERARHQLLIELSPLNEPLLLEQQVYVASHLSPESFERADTKGGVLLRFVRPNEFSSWQLDEELFLILEDK